MRVMAVQFTVECYYFRHIDCLLQGRLSEFAAVYGNGSIDQVLLLLLARTDRHPLHSEGVPFFSLVFEVSRGIHGNVAHLRPPVVAWSGIPNLCLIGVLLWVAEVEALFEIGLIGVFYAFLIDLIDAVVDISGQETLQLVVSTAFVQVFLSLNVILRGLLVINDLFGHIFLQGHALYKGLGCAILSQAINIQ